MDNQPPGALNDPNGAAQPEGGKKTAPRARKQPQELPEDYEQWLEERVFEEEAEL
jgi:hypothetical protein